MKSGQYIIVAWNSRFSGLKKGERLALVVGLRGDGPIKVLEWIASSKRSRAVYTYFSPEDVVREATISDFSRFNHRVPSYIQAGETR